MSDPRWVGEMWGRGHEGVGRGQAGWRARPGGGPREGRSAGELWRLSAVGCRLSAGTPSTLTLARGGVAHAYRCPRGAAARAPSRWPRRRRGPCWRPAPHAQDGRTGPGVPTSCGGGGQDAPTYCPRPSRVLVPADRAALRLRFLRKPPAVRAVPHSLPAGAGQELDRETGRQARQAGRPSAAGVCRGPPAEPRCGLRR